MVQRLFVDAMLAQGALVDVSQAAAHYLGSVLRLREGDCIRLIDDRTGEWEASIKTIGRRAAVLHVLQHVRPRETPPDIWLCMAPLKKGRIDWVAEKACELGVSCLMSVVTRRTVVETPNLERLRAHMIEAAEQCGRTALPTLASPVPLAQLLETWPDGRALLFADEEGGMAVPLCPPPAAILIGPEGGFTPEERTAIRNHPAVVAVSLGPRILRADTAAVAALAVWMSRSGDWSH